MQNRIKLIRQRLKLTQTEFGERIGVKGNTVTNYESGLRTPSNAIVAAICREYSVNEDWLRTGEGEPFIQLSRDAQIARFIGEVMADQDDGLRRRFLQALMGSSTEELQAIAAFAQRMAADPPNA